MSANDAPAFQSAGPTDAQPSIDDRTRRALDECMTVLPGDRDGAYTVVGENDETYQVDLHARACSCPDHEYRDAYCKHLRRCEVATGREPLPAHVATVVDVDPLLGEAVPGEVRVAAADGGMIVAGDGAEVLTDDDSESDVVDDGRPDDCDCGAWNAEADLPCWPCHREGFERPTSAGDTDAEV